MLNSKRDAARDAMRGQPLPVFAVFLAFVLLLSTALVIDYGSWLKVRRDYQNAVDAAVLQGAVLLDRPVTPPKQIAARKAAWTSLEGALGVTLPATDPSTGLALWATSTAIGAPI